jgi:hypothetical protein
LPDASTAGPESSVRRRFNFDDPHVTLLPDVVFNRDNLQLKATFGGSLSNLVALLRQQLFVYRDLWVWIDHPFQAPELPESQPEQLAMVWQ